ncbi:hypothetical protein [Methylobacterium aerolatum]|uniref:Competence protein ComEC n=1 Tax=Methylobacterium aerolatum TaxID=418708 RepID=A0ABU0HWV9_9HYPH|nr:hypothetical protein [Methylobacterium aerolatum]MDQ0446367.1 competence protein ComEC [Methylobacterium aerolatum]
MTTRFRAYQLGTKGSSFSYFADGHFTVIEGRLNEVNRRTLLAEMEICGVTHAGTLHVTSWDADHCAGSELEALLSLAKPAKIECPGYAPHTVNGETCLDIIEAYRHERRLSNRGATVRAITPEYIAGLQRVRDLAFEDTLHNPVHLSPSCDNDNSTVKHFRRGDFNVLSLGDVESSNIGARLRRLRTLRRETDVMILAHHGADNGFTTKKFLRHLEPTLAICSSDYANMYNHPTLSIRELLYEEKIRLMTTKTGDVIVMSLPERPGVYRAINLRTSSTRASSVYDFVAKKSRLLAMNDDSLRQLYAPRLRFPR